MFESNILFKRRLVKKQKVLRNYSKNNLVPRCLNSEIILIIHTEHTQTSRGHSFIKTVVLDLY